MDAPDPPKKLGSEAFSDFYRAEQPAQVRRAALMLKSDQAANDVVHEAFAEVYRRWDSIENPAAYLNRSVLNGCRAVGRQRSQQSRLVEKLRPVDASRPHDEWLLDVLHRLPFNQRAAVVLRFYAQMSEREIADALDTPTGSIGPWINRALKTLRKELS